MNRYKVPACYFPATVVFVDDDAEQLKKLSGDLDITKFSPKFFTAPQDALHFLQKQQSQTLIQRCLSDTYEEEEEGHKQIAVAIPAIRKQIYDPARFSEISVLVTDFAMPGLNGLELCKALQDKPCKKLMLTGEGDERMAIEAFNNGIIDKFIKKDAPNFSELINASIVELQQQYFLDLSTTIYDNLKTDSEGFHYPDDPVFSEFFSEICKNNDVTEYYLLDIYSSYLFLDFEGNPSWLAMKNEEGMRGAYDFAYNADEPFPSDMLEDMEKNKKILFLYEKIGFSYDIEECKKYLRPAKKLNGKQVYYYAVIKDPDAFDIQRNKILSYKDYLRKQKANV